MASRVVEVLYQLKDLFTPTAKKIEKSYGDLSKSAEDASKSVEETNEAFGDEAGGGLLGKLRKLATAAKGAAIFGTIAVGAKELKDSLEAGAKNLLKFNREAAKLGATVQEFDDLKDVAGQQAVRFQDLEKATRQINKRIEDFAKGVKGAEEPFDALLIDAQEFAQLDIAERFERLAEAVQNLGGDQDAIDALTTFVGAKAGTGITELFTNGPAATKAIFDNAKGTGAVFDDEVIPAAERLSRIFGSIKVTSEGIAQNISNFAITTAGGIAEALGLGDAEISRVDQLNDELRVLRSNLAVLEEVEFLTDDQRRQQQEILEQIKVREKALNDLEDATEKANEAGQARIDARTADTAEVAALEDQLDAVSDAYSEQTKKLKAELDKQNRDVTTARRQQARVEKEFANLVDDISGQDEDVGLGTVFGSVNQAKAAAEQGRFQDAIELAQEGGDFLKTLKENGEQSQGTLNFLASQLQDVANKAAAANTAAEQAEATATETTAAAITEQLKNQQAAIEQQGQLTGAALGRSIVAGAQQELARLVEQIAQIQGAVDSAAQAAGSASVEWTTGPKAGFRKSIDQSGPK